ncbi:hypothetical protein V494_06381 [Pseudogymnoascus sp. VKM F-4513 (FW-928)]|nr:hypothetical protein V494_06381 [Pseudogymnoascus sp. VKM F-4513 (FW-928)]
MTLASNLLLPIRGAQLVFSLIVMGVTADTTAHYWDAPNEVISDTVLLIVSVWTLLVLSWLVITPIVFPKVANKWAILVLDILTMVLWIVTFPFLADFTAGLCQDSYSSREKKCKEFKVAVVFGALNSALFIATSIMAAVHCRRTRGGNNVLSQPAYAGA